MMHLSIRETAESGTVAGCRYYFTQRPNTISRENVQRKLVVSANVSGGGLSTAVDHIRERIAAQVDLPPGYRIEYGGQFESIGQASVTLLIASLMAIAVIFLLLYHEFKNLSLAGIVLLNLPLSLIGGVFAIWITSGVLSIPAIIGFITLFGIATRNGILLISRYKSWRLMVPASAKA
jgi:Cu/Ag efflux pump CusA